MPGKGENKPQAGKNKEDRRDVVSGSGEAGRNSSTLGGSSSSHSQAQPVQAQQIQAVRALVQDIIKGNPAARVPGAAAAAAVNKGPSTEVEIDDILDEIFGEDEDSPAVEASSTQGGTKDVQMEDAPAAEGTKPEETKSGETTDTEDGSGDEKSGGEEDGLEE
ncbi:hypothetical protein Neosp_014281 [[Neocosmospora] mangrovei]